VPSALASTEIVIGALVLIAVALLGMVWGRRRYIAGGLPLTLCAMRPAGTTRWRLGLIRFGDNALEWFSLGGVALRPRHRWQRQRMRLEAPVGLTGSDVIAVLPDAFRVPFHDGSAEFELALQGPDYTALRSWQEAAPPGWNVNVA
jgi:hypothetical protein